jgi:hypothetical protein
MLFLKIGIEKCTQKEIGRKRENVQTQVKSVETTY